MAILDPVLTDHGANHIGHPRGLEIYGMAGSYVKQWCCDPGNSGLETSFTNVASLLR